MSDNAEKDAAIRRGVNGHTLELRATYWRCLQCDHRFENAADAEGFWCGDDCTGRHIPPAERTNESGAPVCERVCVFAMDVGLPEYAGMQGKPNSCGNCAHYVIPPGTGDADE